MRKNQKWHYGVRLYYTSRLAVFLHKKKRNPNPHKWFDLGFSWWAEVDSNHRSRRRQIYSLIHLAALESARMLVSVGKLEPVIGLEPTTC